MVIRTIMLKLEQQLRDSYLIILIGSQKVQQALRGINICVICHTKVRGLITLLYKQFLTQPPTWEAISDSMQLKINIVELSQNFRETTIIEPTLCNDAENIQSVYIGHIDFVDYTTVYNITLAFAHHFRCQIIHDSTSLMLYSEV